MEDIATNTCIRFLKTDGNDGFDFIDIQNMKGFVFFNKNMFVELLFGF